MKGNHRNTLIPKPSDFAKAPPQRVSSRPPSSSSPSPEKKKGGSPLSENKSRIPRLSSKDSGSLSTKNGTRLPLSPRHSQPTSQFSENPSLGTISSHELEAEPRPVRATRDSSIPFFRGEQGIGHVDTNDSGIVDNGSMATPKSQSQATFGRRYVSQEMVANQQQSAPSVSSNEEETESIPATESTVPDNYLAPDPNPSRGPSTQELHLMLASMDSQDFYDQILADDDNDLDPNTLEIVGRYIDHLQSTPSVDEQPVAPPSLDQFKELGNIDPEQLMALQGMLSNIQDVAVARSASMTTDHEKQAVSRSSSYPESTERSVKPLEQPPQPKDPLSRLDYLLASMEKEDRNGPSRMSLSMEQLYGELKLLSHELGDPSVGPAVHQNHIPLIETCLNKILIERALEGRISDDSSTDTPTEIMSIIGELKRWAGYEPEKTPSLRIDAQPPIEKHERRSDPPTSHDRASSTGGSKRSDEKQSRRSNRGTSVIRMEAQRVEKKMDPDTYAPDLVRDTSGELAHPSDQSSTIELRVDPLLSIAGSSSVEMDALRNLGLSESDKSMIGSMAEDVPIVHQENKGKSKRSQCSSGGLNIVHPSNSTQKSSPRSRLPPSPEQRMTGPRRTRKNKNTIHVSTDQMDEKKEEPQSPDPTEEKPREESLSHVLQAATSPASTKSSAVDDATLPSFLLADSVSIDLLPSNESDNEKPSDPLLQSENFDNFSGLVCRENDTEDRRVLAHVVRFTFPFLCDGSPTQDEYDGLRAEAIGMGLSRPAADRFFGMIQSTFFDENGPKAGLSSELFTDGEEGIRYFLERLIKVNASKMKPTSDESINRNKPVATPQLPPKVPPHLADDSKLDSYSSGDLLSENDLDDVYAHDVPPGADETADDSIGSNDDPWWEVPQKIAARSAEQVEGDDLDGLGDSTQETKDLDSEEKKSDDDGLDRTIEAIAARAKEEEKTETGPANVDQDIENFWKVQEDLRDRKEQEAAEAPKIVRTRSTDTRLTNKSLRYNQDVWIRKRSMAVWNEPRNWLSKTKFLIYEVDDPEPIDGVEASAHLPGIAKEWSVRGYRKFGHRWQESYKKRASGHRGFLDVDVNSLYLACSSNPQPHRHDKRPWEHREVKQRFLHEPSVAFSRNWFGDLSLTRGNVLLKMPVCRPKSMEMPMRAPGWDEDWFRTPSFAPLGSNLYGSSDGQDMPNTPDVSRLNNYGSDEMETTEAWEDVPECGTLKNVKQRPGDRITRLTPELTSSLRRSRWRKKFFPRGTFPY